MNPLKQKASSYLRVCKAILNSFIKMGLLEYQHAQSSITAIDNELTRRANLPRYKCLYCGDSFQKKTYFGRCPNCQSKDAKDITEEV